MRVQSRINGLARARLAHRTLVTGGAGFIGSHLCDALLQRGDHVICLDNLFSGSMRNVRPLLNHPNFSNPLLPNFIADVGAPDYLTGRHTGFYPLQATGDVGIGNPFLGGGGPRGIQLAAKFTF